MKIKAKKLKAEQIIYFYHHKNEIPQNLFHASLSLTLLVSFSLARSLSHRTVSLSHKLVRVRIRCVVGFINSQSENFMEFITAHVYFSVSISFSF